MSWVNVEPCVFVNVFYLVLLVIYVLCKLYHRKKIEKKLKKKKKKKKKKEIKVRNIISSKNITL